jgi:hypothetical protein
VEENEATAPRLVGQFEAAEILGCSVVKIDKHVQNGTLRFIIHYGTVRFSSTDLESELFLEPDGGRNYRSERKRSREIGKRRDERKVKMGELWDKLERLESDNLSERANFEEFEIYEELARLEDEEKRERSEEEQRVKKFLEGLDV